MLFIEELVKKIKPAIPNVINTIIIIVLLKTVGLVAKIGVVYEYLQKTDAYCDFNSCRGKYYCLLSF